MRKHYRSSIYYTRSGGTKGSSANLRSSKLGGYNSLDKLRVIQSGSATRLGIPKKKYRLTGPRDQVYYQ